MPHAGRLTGGAIRVALMVVLLLQGGTGASEQEPHFFEMEPYIEGYTTRKSFVPGETIEFCVSTSSETYSLSIIRETEFELPVLEQFDGLAGELQPVADRPWEGAGWDVSFSMTVPARWPTGSYRVRFSSADGATNDHPFTVRPEIPGTSSRILFVTNYTTREAYNAWGGKNVYGSDIEGDPTQAHKVSFLRPLALREKHSPFTWVTNVMHSHLEQAGFELEYLTEWDVHLNPCILRHYDMVIFSGHHEYISRRIYDALEMHQDRGGHLLFFSGDDISWQSRYEDDGRTVVCYRGDPDPWEGLHDCLTTTRWWSELLGRPPELLKGVRMIQHSQRFEPGDFLVQQASHWIFEGTGLRDGDALGTDLAHGEGDNVTKLSPNVDVVLHALRDEPLIPEHPPPVESVEISAVYFEKSPAYGFPDGLGGAVFATSSLYGWMVGLEETSPGWEQVRLVTCNVMQRMVDNPPPPPPPGGDCPLLVSCFLTLADLDDDGTIGFADLLILMTSWGPCDDCVADIDNDGAVGLPDLLGMLSNWGT